MEEWRAVVGFEGLYEVSDFGQVRTIKTGRIKKPTINKNDKRPFMLLWKENKYTAVRIHRLVLFAFVGESPPKFECCHNDGNSQNNRLDNLRWDTAASNQADRVLHGTSNRGECCAASKLTEEQVHKILADPRPQKEIAPDYGVLPAQISRIKGGKRWGHLASKI